MKSKTPLGLSNGTVNVRCLVLAAPPLPASTTIGMQAATKGSKVSQLPWVVDTDPSAGIVAYG
jgi:hypothetical protein